MTEPGNANWQSYWTELPVQRGTAIWDSDPAITASAQLPLFSAAFGADRVVLDIGCGNGSQTRALAEHFPRVVGLDFAPAAVEQARSLVPDVEFRVFDLTDTAAASALHDEFGDVNVYMRGVLHQMPDELRPAAAASLRALLGATGALFAVELAPAAGQVIQSAMGESDTAIPKMRRVLQHGLTPAAWQDGKLEEVLGGADLDITGRGEITLLSTENHPNGDTLELPMTYALAKSR